MSLALPYELTEAAIQIFTGLTVRTYNTSLKCFTVIPHISSTYNAYHQVFLKQKEK